MELSDAVKSALAACGISNATVDQLVPGIVSPIHRAVENNCFVASGSGRNVFVKCRHDDMTDFIRPTRVVEASFRAGELGIAPRLLHSDADNAILIFEALGDEWQWGRQDVLRRPQNLERLFAAKRKFHGATPLTSSDDLFDKISHYQILAEGLPLPKAATIVAVGIERIAAAIRASGTNKVPCHADGVSSNVMVGPKGEILLVDFEWACQSDPAHDLGTVLAELCTLDADAMMAVEIATGKPDAQMFSRARLFGAADDLMWAYWGFICGAHSSRKHVEFFKYAEWRLLRARTVIEGPHFEKWLMKA